MADDRATMVARGAAVVLLAAGRATRFGGGKLGASLLGRPLVHHAAALFSEIPFAHRYVVRTPDTPPLDDFGFTPLDLDPPGTPMSRSIAIGVSAAREAGVRAVVVALADMPFVPASHVRALLAAFDGDRITSWSDGHDHPPAIFGCRWFEELMRLDGDRGASGLLRAAPRVALSIDDASDVDTAEDLARAQGRLRQC